MERPKDSAKVIPRSTLDTIDHYAGIGILTITGGFILAILYWVIKSWPI